jgi:hypothetical protein
LRNQLATAVNASQAGSSNERLSFKALFRFFLVSRVTRIQWAVAFLYGVSVLHFSFFSPKFKGLLDYRLEWFWKVLPVVWPLWLVDDDMDVRGAVRLFVVPRHRLRELLGAYVSARLLVAVGIALFCVLATFNIRITELTAQDLLYTTVLAVFSCTILVAVSTCLGMYFRGAFMIVALYTSLILLIRIEFALPPLVRRVVETFALPLWPFALVTGAPVLSSGSWQIVQVPVAVAFWMWLATLVFRRRFR